MPLYESSCQNPGCEGYGRRVEWFSHVMTLSERPCPICGQTMTRLPSRFSVVWTGAIVTKYNDRSLEGGYKEGHWAWRVRSSRSGHPEPVWIDTFQKQAEFCKEEKLINPKELPTNAQVSSDGMKLESSGMPGQWI